MDPMGALSTDQIMFNSELDLLLSAPAVSESSKTTTSPPRRKRSAEEDNASVKRVRSESRGEIFPAGIDDILNVHPSRRHVLNVPNARANIGVSSHVRQNDKDVSRDNTLVDRTNKEPAGSGAGPRSQYGRTEQARTWRTLTNSVRRQWDARKDDLDYEFLVEQRRKEKLANVDRYVPVMPSRSNNAPKRRTVFPLERLPEDLRARVFEHILVTKEPISIDFYWLRSFIRGHARVPTVMQSAEVNKSTYVFPVGWNQLLADVQTMMRWLNSRRR